MNLNVKAKQTDIDTCPGYRSILLAVDSSDHANRGITEAIYIAGLFDARITAAHVYAAKMHDLRFRQMEGGLPDQFRVEEELERQRDVHDDLITRGLSIITDSYLDQAQASCEKHGVEFHRCALEGKNYRTLSNEASSGAYDLLVIGALGLGAVRSSRVGTVCNRVVRRATIDTLVIKDPQREITGDHIVVAVDGSTRSYGGLVTALEIARHRALPVTVIAAFDPYYHYVAFNRIAGVLSEEAGKVFRFREQEKLHEEIIDSGLARIYEGHLQVAETIARDYGVAIQTELLAGKPHDVIEQYLHEHKPALLVIGKLGIHADRDLDIGGNAENLLQNVECSILLSQREYQPELDVLAEVAISWTDEAEQRMQRVPEFVQNMARLAILRYAQERGHTVITERIVEEATARLMPDHAERMMEDIVAIHDNNQSQNPMDADRSTIWTTAATTLLNSVTGGPVRNNLRMRAEKRARTQGSASVEAEHIGAFIPDRSASKEKSGRELPLTWQVTALARLMQAPEGFMRDMSRTRIEEYARGQGISEISLDVAEQGLLLARQAMQETLEKGGRKRTGKCPFTANSETGADDTSSIGTRQIPWSTAARAALAGVPDGYCVEMTRNAIETIAARSDLSRINVDFVEQMLKVFATGSKNVEETLPWEEAARRGVSRAPDMIRGMLIREIEAWARRHQVERVDRTTVNAVKAEWETRGVFHLDPDDTRN